MVEIKYNELEKEVTVKLNTDHMTWKELVDHFIGILPSMGYDGINVNDISHVIHTQLDSVGDIRERDEYGSVIQNEDEDYNMNWALSESDVSQYEGDDEDEVKLHLPQFMEYDDAINDEEDY